MKGLADLGCFGIKIPKQYGGLGFSQTNYNRVIAAVSSYCPSLAVLLSAHQSIGVPQPLKMFGTEDQKQRWLPRLAKGAVSAFALTEVGVGSDPAQMQTTAVPSEDGQHWILNGEKLWCTNGTIADIIVVMAATPPKKLPDGREKKQITAFIVEKNMPGFEVVHRCEFMGLKGIYNGLLRFKNVKVPKDNILWGVGKGLKLALITLNTGRLTLPAACTAAAKMCLQVSRNWANDRVQWGARIGEHEAPASRLVLAAGASYALDSVSLLSSGLADKGGIDIRIEASLAKLFTTGLGWRVIDNTLQLRGGRGFETSESLRARGEDAYPIEKIMRDYRINMIIEGTSGIQRLFVSREALDKHLKVAGEIFLPNLTLGQKARILFRAALFYMVWFPRLFIPVVPPMYAWAGLWESGYLRFVARSSRRLARKIFFTMIRYGPKLEKKQLTLFRIVDAGMNLFVMSAVLSRYLTRKKRGQLQPREDALVQLICETCKAERSAFRHIHSASYGHIVNLSKSIMAQELLWLEDGIADIEGMAKKPPAQTKQPGSRSTHVVAGK